ncbi:hypothetical protein Peur_018234 [Populus x canadensis]
MDIKFLFNLHKVIMFRWRSEKPKVRNSGSGNIGLIKTHLGARKWTMRSNERRGNSLTGGTALTTLTCTALRNHTVLQDVQIMGQKRLSQRIQDAKRAEDEYKGVEIQMEMTRTRKDLWNIYVQLRLNKMIGVIERGIWGKFNPLKKVEEWEYLSAIRS